MFNRPNRNDVDDGVQDIQNDVNQLADSLESVLKSWGSDAKGEAEAARCQCMSQLVYFSSSSENTQRFIERLGLPAVRIPLNERERIQVD